MRRALAFTTLAASLALAACASTHAAEPPTADPFEREVKPLLTKFCVGCHGDRRPKAGINLGKAMAVEGDPIRRDPDFWLRVSDALSDRSMPPKEKPQPTEAQREAFAGSIQDVLDAMENVVDPGRTMIQRLTRDQYNKTVRDLLGLDTRPADAFPADGGGGSGFDNNASTLFVPPILMEKYLAAATDLLDRADPDRWRVATPSESLSPEDAARRCVSSFADRAFRRPSTPAEVDRLLTLFRKADARGRPFDDAVKLALKAVLVSPHFLFIVETDKGSPAPYRVGEYELASRLSYFLWSSMPDDRLFRLAAEGTLHDPKILDAEVRRMLADGKSRAFAESFAGQWLRVDGLATAVEPDRGLFPTYTPELREAMTEEPIAFFHALLRENRPLSELVGCDYAYVNATLAQHYGLDGVTGPDFRKVALQGDARRGGVLGMAGVLTITSYARRTSPVLRGKWVLEELLGTPPPPPPPDVKVLPPEDKPKDGKTFRQRLEMHRSNANCASCHARLDPPGFGLENFDAIGRWRTEIGGTPVDASGEFAGGAKFQGPAELKALLLKDKPDLIRKNIARRMLSYALRRGLEYYDTTSVNAILEALGTQDARAADLVVAVTRSFPFQYRRDEPAPVAIPNTAKKAGAEQ